MDVKKVRNAGVVSALSLALALGAIIGSSMSAGAQGQTASGNDKPDANHPIVQAVNGNTLTLAVSPDLTRDVKIDASTLVVKDGKFAGISALKIGDKVQINPSTYLPSGMGAGAESAGASSTSKSGTATNQDPTENKSDQNPDGSGTGQTNVGNASNGSNGTESAQPSSSSNNEGATNQDPTENKSDQNSSGSSATTPASTVSGPGGENSTGAPSAASIIWVASQDQMLLTGSVNWAQGDTAVLKTPGVAYSEYVIHTTSDTGYQSLTSVGAAPTSANAADMKTGSVVLVLGSDGGQNNPGFFTAKAILVLPASGKLR